MIIRIDIGQPAKDIWPNGRPGNHQAKSRQMKAAKNLANLLTREQLGAPPHDVADLFDGDTIPVFVTCHYRNEAHRPDRDNIVGVLKPYLDGMAERIRVDDRNFAEPVVEFSKDPKRKRGLVVQLGPGF